MAGLTKRDVLKIVESMPDDASLEDILYRVYVHAKIEAGLEDIRQGRTVPHEQVMREITERLLRRAPPSDY